MATKSKTKNSRTKYFQENRGYVRKLKDLERHIEAFPNDIQSKKALQSLKDKD